MAKILEAFRLVLDECSIDEWKQRMPAGPACDGSHRLRMLEYFMIELATVEYRKPCKLEVYKNISRFYTYVDIYFDFATEQERFKFRLAGKGEELQKKLTQHILNNKYLQPIKVINNG